MRCERLFPGQDQSFDARLIVLLLLQHAFDLLCQIAGMPGVVTSLRRQLARLSDVIAIALDFLLRLGEMTLGRLQRAWRIASHLRFVGLRDQVACLVENAALDADQFGIAQQHLGFGGPLLRIGQIAAFILAHGLLETLGRLGPGFRRELRRFGNQCVLARLDHTAQRLFRARRDSARFLQRRLALLHASGNFFSASAAFSFLGGRLTGLDCRSESLRREHIELLGAGLFNSGSERRGVDIAGRQRRSAGQAEEYHNNQRE